MKAVVKRNAAPGVEYAEVPRPAPGPNEVLIQVMASAICGTDIHYYKWNQAAVNFSSKFGLTFPLIMGHEVAGTIVELGSDIKTLQIGQRIAVETHISCGKCYQCQTGEAHNCQNMGVYGTSCDGCFAEYALVPENAAFVLSDQISFEQGALFEPAGVAMRAVEEAHLMPGDAVVVIGCGPIGMLAVQILKACGAGCIIAVDIDDYRLSMVEKYASVTVNSAKQDVVAIVGEATKNRGGADVVLEMTGASEVYESLFEMLRQEGRVVTVGHPAGEVSINITRDINLKGAAIKGLFGRRIWNTWWKLASLVENKKIDILDIVTHRYTFEDCQQAFAQTGKDSGKILFVKPE